MSAVALPLHPSGPRSSRHQHSYSGQSYTATHRTERPERPEKGSRTAQKELKKVQDSLCQATQKAAQQTEELEMVKAALSYSLVAEWQTREQLEAARADVQRLEAEREVERKAWAKERKTLLLRKWLGANLFSHKRRKEPEFEIGEFSSRALSALAGPTDTGVMGVVFNGDALDDRPPPTHHREQSGAAVLFPSLAKNLENELRQLDRAAEDLQRSLNTAFKRIRSEEMAQHAFTRSTPDLRNTRILTQPTISRNLHLFVGLYDAGQTSQAAEQISSIIRSTAPPPTFTCGVCMDDLDASSGKAVEGCGHILCKDCLGSHIRSKLDDAIWPIRCPTCQVDNTGREPAGQYFSYALTV